MKTQTLTLISITTSLALSLLATLATYNVISYPDLIIVGGGWVHRGWPLHWIIESWSLWSPPPYQHYLAFQPANFLVDLIFYTIIFGIPILTYMYSRKARKPRAKSNVSTP